MASTASGSGSAHSLSAGPAGGNVAGAGGGMDELLPLVLQLTNAESVSTSELFSFCLRGILSCSLGWVSAHPIGFVTTDIRETDLINLYHGLMSSQRHYPFYVSTSQLFFVLNMTFSTNSNNSLKLLFKLLFYGIIFYSSTYTA